MARNFIGHQPFKGRGALSNPSVRFEALTLEQTFDGWYREEVPESLNETVLPDSARSVIAVSHTGDLQGCNRAVSSSSIINPSRRS